MGVSKRASQYYQAILGSVDNIHIIFAEKYY